MSKPLFPVRGDSGQMLNQFIDVMLSHGLKFNRKVEIGAYAGLSATIFASRFKIVYSVDPWINQYDTSDKICNEECFAPISDAEAAFDYNIKSFKNIYKFKMFSHEASKFFGDNTLDFVYIDGDHQYEPTKLDIQSWLPKIKSNGIIGGHDWDFESVQQAVNELLNGATAAPITDQNWFKIIK